jgi:hypothetical protein
MVTYKKIQEAVKEEYGFVAKTCWIAHILSDYGLTKGKSHNRIDPNVRKYPCPQSKRFQIEQTMKRFKIIQ